MESEIHEYIDLMKQVNYILLQYIDENESQDYLLSLKQIIEEHNISENKEKLGDFLRLILIITNNHNRNSNFFNKIEKILFLLKDKIKKIFPNDEIFDIFKSNKQIVLFLIENELITINDDIIHSMIFSNVNYFYYFFNKTESFLNDERRNITKLSLLNIDPKIFQSFQLKQKDGVNDDYVCTLIREDSIEEFVSYFNMSNLPLSATVKQSIFETNPLLCEKSATLIEYSAFYGSIQIFNFMKMNGVELSPSLWIYAIHSRNPEMIHLLEELHVKPEDKTYQSCLKEAIKCHHNEIANYIQDNLLTNYNEKNIVSYCFKFHNFATFPNNYDSNSFFYYFCKFNYLKLVKIFMKYEEIDLNSVFIFKK
ncbi:hypothetical protein M9Y10_010559 [Tritrichomonas musculus]|uniref:DUF3447 domain-containing protein n=1 Tax=Tritrichomonas musculus TaxID=1915356 RepID=A0ABR2IL56_9EUKA